MERPVYGELLWSRHTPVVRLLMERGADPTAVNNYDVTPLISASSRGHLDTVRCLLGHPSAAAAINNRDYEDETALFAACEGGRGEVARLLLERGADPTIANDKGISPMARANTRS
jgi:ankyrin repeat protein